MNKPVVGIVVGAVLGLIDGATAWFTPAVRPFMTGILLGSTIKGLVVGVLCGLFARKVHSNPAGIALGRGAGTDIRVHGGGDAVGRRATITISKSCCRDL